MFDYAHIAWKDVFGHRARSLLSVGGIAVIVAVFLVLTSVATGLASIMAGTEGSARNRALIDRGGVGDGHLHAQSSAPRGRARAPARCGPWLGCPRPMATAFCAKTKGENDAPPGVPQRDDGASGVVSTRCGC